MRRAMIKLEVYYGQSLAGYLTENNRSEKEKYSFVYDSQYLSQKNARPISVNLALREEEYTSSVLFPFFDNLLAEGWLLDHQLREHRLNRTDRFALIERCGLEAMGAVSLRGGSDG